MTRRTRNAILNIVIFTIAITGELANIAVLAVRTKMPLEGH